MGTVVLFLLLFCKLKVILGLLWWLSGRESACQCRRCWRWVFDPWVGKTLWSRKWQPTPVFSWTEKPGGLQSMGSQRTLNTTKVTEHSTACCRKTTLYNTWVQSTVTSDAPGQGEPTYHRRLILCSQEKPFLLKQSQIPKGYSTQ